ncbi:extracellular solute-binding protein [Pseudarthrobacter sp. MDT3-26]|nr:MULTISPECIES: extracellular solute-binding protein [unclassified Pseudarthrobacter]MCO4239058.1 extracellular solute-binding protein [Pseudarthrobacter sp. MDT3-28]MCO4264648.1 extracellular solute-binding protein [Pseudarthrobacter sp. MDT3-26]
MKIRAISRRRFQFGAVAVAVSLLATGCGAPAGSSENSEVTLRFAWWGNEYLNAQTERVIDAFEAEHPNIKIESEPGEWASYWDKLATTTAANDAPDVIQMDQKYIAEYGGRGALLDLAKQGGIDTSKLDKESLASGQYDNAQYGLSTGKNAYVIMANTKVFEAANVPVPDDTTWTWDDWTPPRNSARPVTGRATARPMAATRRTSSSGFGSTARTSTPRTGNWTPTPLRPLRSGNG